VPLKFQSYNFSATEVFLAHTGAIQIRLLLLLLFIIKTESGKLNVTEVELLAII